MKFLHLSDLHLGRQLADVSLLPDQEAILDQIVSVAENEKADAVLISGDVYQRSSPQAEAMALFDAFVSRLAQDGRRVETTTAPCAYRIFPGCCAHRAYTCQRLSKGRCKRSR